MKLLFIEYKATEHNYSCPDSENKYCEITNINGKINALNMYA